MLWEIDIDQSACGVVSIDIDNFLTRGEVHSLDMILCIDIADYVEKLASSVAPSTVISKHHCLPTADLAHF
jgi:hypothetical protein